MFTEDDLLPISALQHLAFCERQWGLIYLEQIWDENRLTAEGRAQHDRVHEPESESRPGIRIARSLRLHSMRLGLVGQADVVEFHIVRCGTDSGTPLRGIGGEWQPFPVEYKRGNPKISHCDLVQLCAQAVCLEEMLGVTVPKGAIFYGQPRRREEIDLNQPLREEMEELAARLHDLFEKGVTPPARFEKKCKSCSLLSQCVPRVTGVKKNVARYLATAGRTDEETET